MTDTGPGPRGRAAALDARLTSALGGSRRADEPISTLSQSDEFPERLLALLDDFGLPACYVPPEFGGRPTDQEELLALWRTLARRDLGLAVAHGATYVGAAPVWLAGDPRLGAELADAVRGGARIGLALTESDHGADLVHTEVCAERTPTGYRLTGTKWPLTNAARGDLVTVLVRTGRDGDVNGYSLLLVRKERSTTGTMHVLPATPTHGLHGADVAGISFDGAAVPGCALIGAEGSGIQTVLRTLQLTRTVSPALSLGAAEHALRLVAGFAAERIGERPPTGHRIVAAALARCAGMLAATEAGAVLTARSAHFLTGELSVLSAVVRGLAPSVVDTVLAELAELLAYCALPAVDCDTGGPPVDPRTAAVAGAFQQIWRDHQVLTVLDGSAAASRHQVIHQFPRLVSGFLRATADRPGLALAVDLRTRVGPLDRSRLTHRSALGCSAIQALPDLTRELSAQAAPSDTAVLAVLRHSRELTWLADVLHARCADAAPTRFPAADAYDLAAAYELLYAGAAVLHLWRSGATEYGAEPLWRDALWARVTLVELNLRLRRGLGLPIPPRDERHDQASQEFAGRLAVAVSTGAPLTPFDQAGAASGEALR